MTMRSHRSSEGRQGFTRIEQITTGAMAAVMRRKWDEGLWRWVSTGCWKRLKRKWRDWFAKWLGEFEVKRLAFDSTCPCCTSVSLKPFSRLTRLSTMDQDR